MQIKEAVPFEAASFFFRPQRHRNNSQRNPTNITEQFDMEQQLQLRIFVSAKRKKKKSLALKVSIPLRVKAGMPAN